MINEIPSFFIPLEKQPFSIPKKWENISDADLGWAAGIIDGEGSLSIGHIKSSNSWSCALSVRNTRKIMIDKLEEIFGGKSFKTKYKYKGIYKPVWSWRINPVNIKSFLLMLYPFLVVKKNQARILIEMRRRIEERVGIEMVYRNVRHGHKSPHLTDEERNTRQSIYYEIKKYNRTGGQQ